MEFSVQVDVTLREGISDPQGSTVERALPHLGFEGVRDVKVGKIIRFVVDAVDEPTALAEVDDMCRRFLTNPVIEDAAITVSPLASV